MGYLIKSEVLDALKEDMETTKMCYDDRQTRDIVNFCYNSMAIVIDRLPQYRVDNAAGVENN